MSVEIRDTGPWTELCLDRPPRNVLDPALLAALRDALDTLVANGAPLLLLRARGRHFSTGYDIADIPAEIFDPDPEVRSSHPFEQVMARLVAYPSPVVAMVGGDAYGGAVELLACADLRLPPITPASACRRCAWAWSTATPACGDSCARSGPRWRARCC